MEALLIYLLKSATLLTVFVALFVATALLDKVFAVLPFAKQTWQVLTKPGFLLLLFGGVAYTVGAVLYGLGGKRRWMHSVFHVFVVLGSGLQFLSILCDLFQVPRNTCTPRNF